MSAEYYLTVARNLLKLHDKGQNLFNSGEITYPEFNKRSDFYRKEVIRYQALAEKANSSVKLVDLY